MEKSSDESRDVLEGVMLKMPDSEDETRHLSLIPVSTTEQLEKVAALANEIWHEYFVTILSLEQIDYMVEKYQSISAMKDQTQRQGYQYYIMMRKGTMIGYCGIREDKNEKSLFLSKLYLHKKYRGNGYASMAMEFLVDLCKKQDYEKIWLTVNRFNEHTIKVYEKKGFIKVRTEVADIGQGFVMDDYIMEKQIG